MHMLQETVTDNENNIIKRLKRPISTSVLMGTVPGGGRRSVGNARLDRQIWSEEMCFISVEQN